MCLTGRWKNVFVRQSSRCDGVLLKPDAIVRASKRVLAFVNVSEQGHNVKGLRMAAPDISSQHALRLLLPLLISLGLFPSNIFRN